MYNQPFDSIDKQAFLANYWQKQPCVFRNAFTDYPNVLSADELAGLALEDEIESRLIQFNSESQTWSLEHGPFEPERFSALPNKDWTLLVQSVDSWIAQTRPLLRNFNFIPRWRFDDLMLSYATDQGGVGPHYDNFDVFLIQGEGKRRWRVGHPGKANHQSEVATGLSQIDSFEVLVDVELNPGDMIYVPPKTAHWGLSLGESIGYSIGYRSPETKQLVTLLAEHLQESSESREFFTDAYRNSAQHHNQFEAELLAWAQSQLKNLAEQPELLTELLCRQLSHSKLGLELENNTNDIQSLTDNSKLRLDEQISVIWHTNQSKIIVSIEGEDFIFEKYLISAIKKLVNFEVCSAKLFKKSPNTVDFPEDLSNLIIRGYVYLVN